ncbi:MAG: thiamine-phosphate kinase [Rhodospirillaceae bacterium]|nr:MAG: thiamine-phosphate kinase [Rhodospirillaceae bacterium]
MTRRPEFELIATLFAPLARSCPGALSLMDDAALVSPSPGHELVVTTDTLIAGVHFLDDDPPGQVAQKALRVNLSDLAAKGARPIGVLQALTLGDKTDDTFLESYARGFADDLRHFNIPLLGGDTTSAPPGGPLVITITALGELPHGTALLRGGAQPGDLLCVSGTIGDAALGLRALRDQLPPASETHRTELVRRYRVPEPRLALGQALRGIATACLDISDGLCADVGHICTVSRVSAEIVWRTIPISQAAQRRLSDDPSERSLILGGGDDYELAFTVPPAYRTRLSELAEQTATPIAVIGRVTGRDGKCDVRVMGDDGREIVVPAGGYVHH